MNKLNISKCIIQKRKEKGTTQEKLAEYIGVSKASVSKWESGQSYPDILLLPELATYFNVSVDELFVNPLDLAKSHYYYRTAREAAGGQNDFQNMAWNRTN
jgi:transcriptional regulator with XRE-family HTH domain